MGRWRPRQLSRLPGPLNGPTIKHKEFFVGLISKDQILSAAGRLPFEDVPVPELAPDDPSAMARISTMTGLQKDAWEAIVYVPEKDGKTVRVNQVNWRANLVAHCWVDETGKRMFETADEVLSLGGLSSLILDRLYQVAKRLNVIGTDEEAKVEKK